MSSGVKVNMNRFGAIAAATRREVGKAVKKTTMDIAAGAKKKAPKKTGFLAASVEADVEKAESDLHGEVPVGAEYGPHVELGTVKQKAQPFLTPASEEQRQPFEQGVAAAVKRAAEQAR